jgi:gliding motility-associated protein GldM
MAGGKLSPRQQMINMMYLVLTALLALNVSKEILDSFVTINEGQETTRAAFEGKLSSQLGNFAALAQENPEKYKVAFDKTSRIHKAATDLVKHINLIKAKTIADTEGLTMEDAYNPALDTVMNLARVQVKDNANVNTQIMIGSEPATPAEDDDVDGNNYRAVVLRQKLEAYRDLVTIEIKDNPKLVESINSLFNYESVVDSEGNEERWETLNFYHVPLAATTSILSKLQADIRNAESDAVGYMFQDVEKSSFKFTALKSAVIPVSTNVTTGSNFEADVFLAAYDDQNKPEIRLGKPGVKYDEAKGGLTGEYDLVELEGTVGKVKLPAGGLGQQMREGVIIFTPVGGESVTKPFTLDYSVVAPTLVVSPSKMNVFYKGVENPVTVGVPGFQDKDVVPSISNGSIKKGPEGYIVTVTSGTEANISVTCTLPDGSKKTLGPSIFRVKSVPDPVAVFGGKGQSDATISFAELNASQGVAAVMKDFDFNLKFTVTKFEISMSVGGQFISKSSSSNRVNPEINEMLRAAKNGQKVFIEGIRAQGPDGTVRSLGSLAFKVVK